jgi:hypothetical protein
MEFFRHHPPGILKIANQKVTQKIGTDSLCTRLRTLCANLRPFRAGDHPPGIKNSPSESYAENRHGQFVHETANVVREFATISRRKPSPPVQPTGGSVVLSPRCRSHYLMLTRCYRSLELAVDRETVRAARTPRHRHHRPGIRNSKSESYAEIDGGSLSCARPGFVRAS